MPREGGHVYAIVRAANNDAAHARLRAGYDTGDHDLLDAFDSLGNHLTVVAGVHSSTPVVYTSECCAKPAYGVVTVLTICWELGQHTKVCNRQSKVMDCQCRTPGH